MALCRCFRVFEGATVQDAIGWAMAVAEDAAEREQLWSGLPPIVGQMIECELLRPVASAAEDPFQSIVIASERPSPVVAQLLATAGYRVSEHAVAGADDLPLVRPLLTDRAALLVAWSLNQRCLYALNDTALETRTPWVFAAALRDTVVVSPVIRPGRSACYACLRFRSLGAMQDGMVGAAIESALIDGRPMVAGEACLAVEDEIVAAGALIKSLATPGREMRFRFVHRSGAVDLVSVLRLPNCPICSAR